MLARVVTTFLKSPLSRSVISAWLLTSEFLVHTIKIDIEISLVVYPLIICQIEQIEGRSFPPQSWFFIRALRGMVCAGTRHIWGAAFFSIIRLPVIIRKVAEAVLIVTFTVVLLTFNAAVLVPQVSWVNRKQGVGTHCYKLANVARPGGQTTARLWVIVGALSLILGHLSRWIRSRSSRCSYRLRRHLKAFWLGILIVPDVMCCILKPLIWMHHTSTLQIPKQHVRARGNMLTVSFHSTAMKGS